MSIIEFYVDKAEAKEVRNLAERLDIDLLNVDNFKSTTDVKYAYFWIQEDLDTLNCLMNNMSEYSIVFTVRRFIS